LNFHFKKGDKFNFKHTEFPINEATVAGFSRKHKSGPNKDKEFTREEKIKAAYDEQADKIKHILTKFMPEKDVILKGATFEDFANSVVKLLGDKFVGKKLRLKLVYNKKNYLSFPKFNFIENVETTPSRLKIDPQWDKLEKDEADKEEDSTDDFVNSTFKTPAVKPSDDF
jgi:hypothetical protein